MNEELQKQIDDLKEEIKNLKFGNRFTHALASPNYVSGSSGWIIKENGDVEFAEGLFRGNVRITKDGSIRVVISSGGDVSAGGGIELFDSFGDLGGFIFSETSGNLKFQVGTSLVEGVNFSESGGKVLVFPTSGGDLGNTSIVPWDNAFINQVALTDGVTAPTTVSGSAFLYVDTADGDLKVKFGDGVTKTIATDT